MALMVREAVKVTVEVKAEQRFDRRHFSLSLDCSLSMAVE